MSTNRDGYATSWSGTQESSWDTFRELVAAGVDVDVAAERAGVDNPAGS
jgi:hypothetical protein